jgi:uncharacterized protein YdaU (DUF1376 family)
MHYYKKNIGDYAKKAGRLSMLQHGAYTLLIDACYDREEFPTLEDAIDWTWASSKEEIEAVEFVLRKFFERQEDGRFVENAIAQELNAYQVKAEKNKEIAQQREAKRKENKTNREVRNNETCTERSPIVNESPPNHKPINHKPINQEPIKKAYAQNAIAFDAFWQAYPKKKDRKKAEQAWLKLKLSEEQANEILKKLAKQLAQPSWLKEDGQFIPYPTTYLNGRRWEDELEPVGPVASSQGDRRGVVVSMSKADREAYELMQRLTGGEHV